MFITPTSKALYPARYPVRTILLRSILAILAVRAVGQTPAPTPPSLPTGSTVNGSGSTARTTIPGSLSVSNAISARNLEVSVLAYSADPSGTADSSAAFQSAAVWSEANNGCVYMPAGTYRLLTPVALKSGACFRGETRTVDYTNGTLLLPKTAAFVTADPLTVFNGTSLSAFTVSGGTNAIDLGQFINVKLENINGVNQTGWTFSSVVSERSTLRGVSCIHSAVNAQGCLSLADHTKSLFASVYGPAWQLEFWDRTLVDSVSDIGDGVHVDGYTVWSNAGLNSSTGGNAVGDSIFSNIVAFFTNTSGMMRFGWIWNVELHDIVADGIGTPGTPVTAVIDFAAPVQSTVIKTFTPGFSTNYYTNGIYFRNIATTFSIENSVLGGDNIRTFGVRFSPQVLNAGSVFNSTGSVYFENPAPNVESAVTIVGSRMMVNGNGYQNVGDVNLVGKDGRGLTLVSMADSNGALPSTGPIALWHAVGGGALGVDFEVYNNRILAYVPLTAPSYNTSGVCTSTGSPAECGSAVSGFIAVPAGTTSQLIHTTAVTPRSQIHVTFDSSVSAVLGLTCESTGVQGIVSARSPGIGFTLTTVTSPTTGAACFSYTLFN